MKAPSEGFYIEPGGILRGRLQIPGDKSISHRALMVGAIAEGVTEITGFLEGADCIATLQALRAMGVPIEGPAQGFVRVRGVGLRGLKAPTASLHLGNSGTSMRLLAGLLVGQSFDVELVGDESLSRRPMRRVTEPLARMGATIESGSGGTPPLRLRGGQPLRGIHYHMPVASAQVKSCLLLAGLYASGETCVREPAPTRDHTERMLRGFGYPVRSTGDGVCVEGGGRLAGSRVTVPADISSAAFFLVGASIAPESEVTLTGVGINPTRTGVIQILREMGADISIEAERETGGEPVADLRVRSRPLHGIDIPASLIPLAIDEFPAVFVAAACAEGTTVLRGAAELRVKESDRIEAMAEGLAKLGIVSTPAPDGIAIRGGSIGGGALDSHGDHRVAMAFAMAALRARAPIAIARTENVATSFPRFVEMAVALGLRIGRTGVTGHV